MKTRHVVLCDGCENPMLKPEDGFVLHGTLCSADPSAEPVMGAPIPNLATIEVKSIPMTAYCRRCFVEKLGLRVAAPVSPTRTTPVQGSASAAPGEFATVLVTMEPPPSVGSPSAPALQVGATKEVASGGHVNAGMGVLPRGSQVEEMPAIPGKIQDGDVVRVNDRHPEFKALRGRAARAERFREKENDWIIRFADGHPFVARVGHLDRLQLG